MIKLLLSLFLSITTGFSVAAGDRLPPQVSVSLLEQGQYCGRAEVGAEWMQSGEAYQRFKSSDEHMVLVSMGMQRSGGYSLALLSEKGQLVDGIVVLQIAWNSPLAGIMTAQVITQPCMILSLKRQAYKGIRIVDQYGVVKSELLNASPQ